MAEKAGMFSILKLGLPQYLAANLESLCNSSLWLLQLYLRNHIGSTIANLVGAKPIACLIREQERCKILRYDDAALVF
jgi:hypothetical protein